MERTHPACASRRVEDGPVARTGTRSGGRTAPLVISKMAAETRGEGPRIRNRSLRTASGEKSPMRAAMSASEMEALRIQCLRETIGSGSPALPAVLPPERLAEVLAILAVDLVEAVGAPDVGFVLERLTNRLDGQGRTAGGSEAAALLGAVGRSLMRLGS